jgi:protein SCO1/2
MTRQFLAALTLLSLLSCGDRDDGYAGRELKQPGAEDEDLPVLVLLPKFAFTDQTGTPFGTTELDGQLWVANFIFTRCVMTCPMQTANLALLKEKLDRHDRWGEKISLVSFSVDPEYDTSDVLRSFGEQYDANPSRWKFLTGAREATWQLSRQGFKLPVGEQQMEVGLPLFHSSMLVLVDRQRQIRGYYDGLDDAALSKVYDDLNRLTEE